MTIPIHNNDMRYELMAALLPGPNENTPDADQVIDDLREILKLCYAYTTTAGTAKEWSAEDLASAIVTYLFGEWVSIAPRFDEYTDAYWNTPTPRSPDPELTRSPDELDIPAP